MALHILVTAQAWAEKLAKKISKEAAKAISAGSSFSGSLLVGYFGGEFASRHWELGHWGTIIGTLAGFLVGNWIIFKILLDSKFEKE